MRVLLGIYGFLPGALMAAGAHFVWRFPLTRAVQEELRTQLEASAVARHGSRSIIG